MGHQVPHGLSPNMYLDNHRRRLPKVPNTFRRSLSSPEVLRRECREHKITETIQLGKEYGLFFYEVPSLKMAFNFDNMISSLLFLPAKASAMARAVTQISFFRSAVKRFWFSLL